VYRLAIKEGLDKKLKKLKRKDPELLQMIERKVQDQTNVECI
jgi:mRNA-degrading endonuclease RelE of RelBE toxin-antitoxin system